MKKICFILILFFIAHVICYASEDALLSVRMHDNENGVVLTFSMVKYKEYSVLWTDSYPEKQTGWHVVEENIFQENLTDNGDGTASWIDKGQAQGMNGVPSELGCRFYKIVSRLPKAKHIILVIPDGIQMEHEIAASRYLYGSDNLLSWQDFQYKAYCTTWDVSTYNNYAAELEKSPYDESTFSPDIGYDIVLGGSAPYPIDKSGLRSYLLDGATDSASAATAMATGQKTDESNVSWLHGDPDNGAIVTIAEKMRAQKNCSIGVVSTKPFSHATPACFVSHNPYRNNYYTGRNEYTGLGIADEIINVTKPEVVIGGGHPDYSSSYISQTLYESLKVSDEYVFVERSADNDGASALSRAAQSAIANNKKLFGLFGGPDGHFEPPVAHDSPGNPLVEKYSQENPSLAESALSALQVLSRDNDGFFLMVEQGDVDSANHANDYQWMIASMWDADEAVKSIVQFVDQPGDHIDWSNTLLIVVSDHANSFMRLSPGTILSIGDLPEQVGTTYPNGEVSYGSWDHTNELVTVYAKGSASVLFYKYEGTHYPNTTIIDNTDIYKVMRDAAGLGD